MDGLHENIAWYTHSGSKPCRQAGAGETPIGVSFAYPTRTVYLARSPGIPEVPGDLSPPQDKALNEERGREAARNITKGAPWRGEKPPPYAFLSEEEALALARGTPKPNAPQDTSETETETRGSEGE